MSKVITANGLTTATPAETVTNVTTETVAPATQTVTQNLSASEILKRSSEAPASNGDIAIDDIKGQIKFDDIKDPVARALAEKRVKELEAGFNKKYEQVANMRKELESRMGAESTWTPEKLDRVLTDPTFISLVQARQQHASANQPPAGFDGNADEWSALTPAEKQQFASLNQKVMAQEQIMGNMLKLQEDEKLKQNYPGYDSRAVDQLQQDFLNGRVQATREHLWKVYNYESDVKRAYELGLKDRNANLTEKINASTNLGNNSVTTSGEVPEEIRKQGFQAIGRWRIGQLKIGSGNK